MSYLKGRHGCVAVMHCKYWWPVCTGRCSIVLLCPAEVVRVWSVMSRTLADYIYTYISEPGSRVKLPEADSRARLVRV
jgi:hypothetical protein